MPLRARVLAAVERVAPPAAERSQRFYQRLHKVSLRGMGYGLDSPSTSGELAFLDRLAHVPMDVIIDAGANRGVWAAEARRRWPAAEIHAFEPAAETFAMLRASVGDCVVCCNAALGDTAGTAVLHHVPGLDGLASLHHRDLASHGMEMSRSETVNVLRLDDYCSASGIARVDLLKMDVEGHELSVLSGASSLLAEGRIERIQFEFGGSNIDSRSYLRDFVRLLEGDFHLSRIVTDGQVPLVYNEQMEIFVTTNFIAERRSHSG